MKTLNIYLPPSRIFIICVLSFITTFTFAQEGYFEQGYGGETIEAAYSVYVKQDHSVIMVGFKEITSSNKDIFVIKTDSLGDTIWTRTIGGLNDDEAFAIIKDRNGNYVIAGYTSSFGAGGKDVFVASINDNGSINWQESYGTLYDETARGIIELPNGSSSGFAIVGTKVISSTEEVSIVLKIGLNGLQHWLTPIGIDGIQRGNSIALINTIDTVWGSGDSIAICGTVIQTGASNQVGYIATLGFDGALGSYISYESLGASEFNSIASNGSNIYVAGNVSDFGNNLNGLLLKTNSSGEIVYHNSYGGESEDGFYHLINFAGFMIATGYTQSSGEGNNDLWQCFIEEDGVLHKELRYGGEGSDIGYHSFLRGSDLYSVGYNSSFGITTSGNMYTTRANIAKWVCNHPNYPDGSMPYPYSWIETVELDCSMKRVLMVRDMFKGIESNFYICKWCTSYPNQPDVLNTFSIPVTDITNSGNNFNANRYTGIIGNDDNETKLLNFCQKHGINQLLFYNAAFLFSRTGPDLPNEYVTVTGINVPGLPSSMTIQKYMTYRLNQFITRAKRDYGIEFVGIIAGGNSYTFNNWKFYDNISNFNQVKADFSLYNYSNTGKINTVMLEDEFWNDADKDANGNPYRYVQSTQSNPAVREANFRTYLFDPHLVGLRRMLDLPYYDRNIVDVFGYYGYLHRMMWFQNTTTHKWYHVNDEDWSNSADQPAILDRVEEIENAAGVKEGFKLSNIFSIYYTTTTATQIYGNGSNPFHRADYAFRTATFGQTRPINIYPLFSTEAYQRSVDLNKPWQDWAGGNDPDEPFNFLGIWLTARDNSNITEQRRLIDVENKWMDGYTSNAYYNATGIDVGNKKFNGFGYFMYEFMQSISEYNISQVSVNSSFENNFSNNTANSAAHVPKDENINPTHFALIGNPCGKCIFHYTTANYREGLSPKHKGEERYLKHANIIPNPHLSGQLAIVFNQPLAFDAQVKVCFTNVVGTTVFQATLTGAQLGQVDVSRLPAGLYVVTITGVDGKAQQIKFIKQ